MSRLTLHNSQIAIFVFLFAAFSSLHVVLARPRDIKLGPCIWVEGRQCPDNDVKFFLFTKKNPNDRQLIIAGNSWDKSNISSSNFDPDVPTKVIMHGFNSDMYLTNLIEMKDEYLQRGPYNLIYVDYSELARGPCYIQSVHNLRHVGECLGNLLNLIYETGTNDIHLIGFSLGAQLANFAAKAIRPKVLPRITGLDPAMPLFVGVPIDDKLDQTDAKFVDVYHTNAFVQGKVEQCGHVDFYFNGGIIQPGCATWKDNPIGCSHNRAPAYYMESIRSEVGFWGWPCRSYVNYLLRLCPIVQQTLILAGEEVRPTSRGMHFIKTKSESPFAMGKSMMRHSQHQVYSNDFMLPGKRRDPLIEELDQWGKLDGAFNNIDHFPTPVPQDPDDDDWGYFGSQGPSEITNNNDYYVVHRGEEQDNPEEYILPPDSEGPYGVQVIDVLHRKHSTRRKPSHRFRTKNGNSTKNGEVHLIQKLWKDYNSRDKERRPSSSSWRRRQSVRDNYEGKFFTLPFLVTRGDDEDSEEVEDEHLIDERFFGRQGREEEQKVGE